MGHSTVRSGRLAQPHPPRPARSLTTGLVRGQWSRHVRTSSTHLFTPRVYTSYSHLLFTPLHTSSSRLLFTPPMHTSGAHLLFTPLYTSSHLLFKPPGRTSDAHLLFKPPVHAVSSHLLFTPPVHTSAHILSTPLFAGQDSTEVPTSKSNSLPALLKNWECAPQV